MRLFPGLQSRVSALPMTSGMSNTHHSAHSWTGPVSLMVRYHLQGMCLQRVPFQGVRVRSSIGFEAVDTLPGDPKSPLDEVIGHG